MDRRVLRILKQVLNVQSIEASHDPILCRTDRYIRRRVSAALSDFLRDTIGDTAIGGEFGTPFSPGGKWQCTWGPATDPDDTNLVFRGDIYRRAVSAADLRHRRDTRPRCRHRGRTLGRIWTPFARFTINAALTFRTPRWSGWTA